MSLKSFKIRVAQKDDCVEIARMLKELAVCLKVPGQFKLSTEELECDGFGPNPSFQCLLAEVPVENKAEDGHTAVGIALYCSTYSMFSGRSLYLESLYVMPEFQGKGLGKALIGTVAKEGLKSGSLKLTVRDWNEALQFYFAQGAKDLSVIDGLHVLYFSEDTLRNMAKNANLE